MSQRPSNTRPKASGGIGPRSFSLLGATISDVTRRDAPRQETALEIAAEVARLVGAAPTLSAARNAAELDKARDEVRELRDRLGALVGAAGDRGAPTWWSGFFAAISA